MVVCLEEMFRRDKVVVSNVTLYLYELRCVLGFIVSFQINIV